MESRPAVTLVILDGWGQAKPSKHNAIYQAKTPTWDWLQQHATHTLIDASGLTVGLPDGQMGNSEVGHMHIGAGRIIYQDLSRINQAISQNTLKDNPNLKKAIKIAKANKVNIHLVGLLSDGGVHSHQDHLNAIISILADEKMDKVYIHPILDGRDTPPQSALNSISQLEKHIKTKKCGKISSLGGRFYAMDRDKRWQRVKNAYDVLFDAKPNAISAEKAIKQAYENDISDEFIKPIALKDHQVIEKDDVVLCFNFRSDRMQELCLSFTEENFDGFNRTHSAINHLFTMTEYSKTLKATPLFPPENIKNTLGEIISNLGLKQFRIAETEKYAHVTFFFNGGRDEPFPLEKRKLIPSPKVKTYDLCPEMSAKDVCFHLTDAIKQNEYALHICNFANADMVGHTGDLKASIKAIETLDNCLKDIVDAIKETGGELLITADHGNAEEMYNLENDQPHTAHTKNPVPFIHFGSHSNLEKFDASLQDITPTILALLKIKAPKEIKGKAIVQVS